MIFKIKIQNLDKLVSAVEKSPKMVFDELSRAITTSVNLIRPIMRGEAPKGKTRKLSENIYARSFGLKGEVGPNLDITPYALYVHRGTGLFGPHATRIRPTTKNALYWKGALHPVKSVKGQVANPFVERTFGQIKEPVIRIFGNTIRRITGNLAV